MKMNILAATFALILASSAALAGADPAPAQKADPSASGDPVQVFRTCIGNTLHEAQTVGEYESVRFVPGTFYVGTHVFFSTGSELLPGVTDCLKKVAAKKR